MKTHLLGWVPIVLFFVVAILSFALHLTRTEYQPCRPTPKICHPRKQPRLCQPFICPDMDRRKSAHGEQNEGE